MKRYVVFALLTLLIALSLSSCAEQVQDISDVPTERAPAPANTGYTNIASDQALKKMDEGVRLIDVRTSLEYDKQGHIPGAELFPLDGLTGSASDWDKDQSIMVICLSGGRSVEAANRLVGLGFKDVYNVEGGMAAYRGETKTGMDP